MKNRNEVFLRSAAAGWIVIVTLMAAFPDRGLRDASTPSALQYLIGAVLGALIMLFYVWMFVECIRGVRTKRRVLWLIFMLVLPVSSAAIYFFITRSREPGESSS